MKLRRNWTGLLLGVALPIGLLCFHTGCAAQTEPENTAEELQALYTAAVRDAVLADTDEIQPLVCLTHEDERTVWDEDGERVLLLSMNYDPDSYPAGEDITFHGVEIWAFSGGEMADWYAENQKGVTDWSLRMNQLLGLPSDLVHTHISAFWVKPEDVIRPAYTTDVTVQIDPALEKRWEEGSWYDGWFDANILYSYFDSAFPWTRLGYTYDWADNGREYGLTEFLVYPDTEVTIEYTVTIEEFIAGLAAAETSEA